MPRTILCSTGTSIAQGCKALAAFQNSASDWGADTSELSAQIVERVGTLNLQSQQGRVRASAELNALHRLAAGGDDEVVLFATDTADGRCCAEAVASVLEREFRVARTKIERIEGLQVRDSARLQRVGLVSLTRRLIHYLDDPQRRYGGGCVLNTNGGFKGLVPFFAILGMIFRAPVVYVFEFAECLISLPPLPVGFATDLFDRALPAIRWADTVQQFDPEEFYRRIPGLQDGEREWFASFLEVVGLDGQNIGGLSPLAQVLSQRECGPTAVLSVSRLALSDMSALATRDIREVHDHLRKLSSPLWRSQHRATKHTNDLEFFPKGQNPWRFAGYSTEDGFRLCWFARHDAYDEFMPRRERQRAAFPDSEFAPFTVPAAISESPEIAESDPDFHRNWHELRSELLDLRSEASKLRAASQERLDTIIRERKELSGVREALRTHAAQNSKFQQQIRNLEVRIQHLQQRPNDRNDDAGTAKSPDDLRTLIGTEVAATYAGRKGRSHRFTFKLRDDTFTACVPLDGHTDEITVGKRIQIVLTGLTGGLFQARAG